MQTGGQDQDRHRTRDRQDDGGADERRERRAEVIHTLQDTGRRVAKVAHRLLGQRPGAVGGVLPNQTREVRLQVSSALHFL